MEVTRRKIVIGSTTVIILGGVGLYTQSRTDPYVVIELDDFDDNEVEISGSDGFVDELNLYLNDQARFELYNFDEYDSPVKISLSIDISNEDEEIKNVYLTEGEYDIETDELIFNDYSDYFNELDNKNYYIDGDFALQFDILDILKQNNYNERIFNTDEGTKVTYINISIDVEHEEIETVTGQINIEVEVDAGEQQTPINQDIQTWYDLDNIREQPTEDYLLVNSLTDNTEGYDEIVGNGFEPIEQFEGSLNGNDYSIEDIQFSQQDSDFNGLFKEIVDSTIENITFSNFDIQGNNYIGAIVGRSIDSTFKNVAVIDSIISGNENVGGFTGQSINSEITDSIIEGEINGIELTGGLVGEVIDSSITSIEANTDLIGEYLTGGLTGSITGNSTMEDITIDSIVTASESSGGLVGINDSNSIIDNISITSQLTGTEKIGGVIGINSSEFKNSTIQETTINDFTKDTGGIIGYNTTNGEATNITSDNITMESNNTTIESIGGAIGVNENKITDISLSNTIINIPDSLNVGGIAGINTGEINSIDFSGEITSRESIGGIVGNNINGVITDSTISDVTLSGDIYIGGVSGQNQGEITLTQTEDVVVSEGLDLIGGISGINDSFIEQVSSGITINIDSAAKIGGIAGQNQGTIEQAQSTGIINGDELIGGIVGFNTETITDVYSDVELGGTELIGGITGQNQYGQINNSLFINEIGNYEQSAGAIVGFNYESIISESYWNEQQTDIDDTEVDSENGLSTTQLQSENYLQSNTSFDFSEIWRITENSYPQLQFME